LDTTIFKEINKKTARSALNINENEVIIAFSAFSVSSPYKGWIELQKALEILKETMSWDYVSILITGSATNNLNEGVFPFKTKFLGFLKDEYSMSLVFNAADVFVAPSLAETFGYVIMEALSCGTPVVAFEVGGISDQIMHKHNGYLAKYREAEDLANGISFCLEERLKGYLLPGFDRTTIIKRHIEYIDYVTGLK
jgi:glycosyltransferase involved in cell wall biosynthesis